MLVAVGDEATDRGEDIKESEIEPVSFGGGSGTESDPYLIEDVHQLQNISEDVTAHYELANDIDASETKAWNDGRGFEPIGYDDREFNGTFDGKGYNITDLYINRSDTGYIGMFGFIGIDGSVSDLGLVDANVSGKEAIGALAAGNAGTVNNTFNTGDVSGSEEEGSWEFTEAEQVGGLVGVNTGTVGNSYSTGNVSIGGHIGGLVGYNTGIIKNSYAKGTISLGRHQVGGLVGVNRGTVDNSFAMGDVRGSSVGGLAGGNRGLLTDSYATGDVKGERDAGGLAADGPGTVINSYFTGNVSGEGNVGGLVGDDSTLKNSHYNINEVQINGDHHLTTGGLFNEQYKDWIEDLKLNIDDYNQTLQPSEDCYEIKDVEGIRDLLGFADNEEYKFCLADNIDLLNESGLYIPYLAADFNGKGYNIENLSVDQPFAPQVGMFGHNEGASVKNIALLDVNISGNNAVGGIVGLNEGYISDSFVRGNIQGDGRLVGALVGWNRGGTIGNSHYNVNETLINGEHYLTIGALYENQYQDWLSSDLTLDIEDYNDTLVPAGEYYEIDGIQGLRNLLGFADREGYKFQLAEDIDLSNESGLYIPYLAADFDGNGYTISSLTIHQSLGYNIGMFGQNVGGIVKNLTIVDAKVNGDWNIGSIVGLNYGIVKDSYATGNVSGNRAGGVVGRNRKKVESSSFSGDVNGGGRVGGLVGFNQAGSIVENSNATGNVNGHSAVGGLIGKSGGWVTSSYSTTEVKGYEYIGGLVGRSNSDSVINSYATGNVTGEKDVGGLIGWNKREPNAEERGVTDSYSTGKVDGTKNVGGLIGRRTSGSVTNSYATGDVTGEKNVGGLIGFIEELEETEDSGSTVFSSYATGNVSGNQSLGGLIGRNMGGSISNSYATGDVGEQDKGKTVGGLVGLNEDVLSRGGLVINSYSTGKVNGNESLGGLIGINDGGNIIDSFWDMESSGIETSDGGTGKTTAEMKDIATYTDETTEGLEEPWDFVCDPNDDDGQKNIWYMDDYQEINDGYPFLNWQDVELGKYELTIDSTEGGEVITPGENTFEYEQWSEVELEAVADENYRFVEWTGDNETVENLDSNQTTIKMGDNYTLTAKFEKIEYYDLTINIEGEGSTTPSEGVHTYEEGIGVTVEAISADGWIFVNWTGDVPEDEGGKQINIIMDENKTIVANFEESAKVETYNLTVNIDGNGTVEVDGEEVEDGWTGEFLEGANVSLEAIADEGWDFVNWTGDLPEDEEGKQINITMDSDKTITAHFEEESVEDGGGGGTPGFTTMILLMSVVTAVAIYRKKKR